MGFDVNRFVDSQPINEDLICNICKGVLEEGVWSPNCEHAFCKACIQQWILRRSQCPNDRQPLNLAHLKPIPRFMRNLLDKLEIKCDFANNGCEQVFHLNSLRDHISVCDYNPDKRVECHMGCGIILKKAELPGHNCVKSLRRALDQVTEEYQRYERINARFRSDLNGLRNENTLIKETLNALQNDVKHVLEDRHSTGIAHISQSTSTSVPTHSSTSKSRGVVPNPYVLITPLHASSPTIINDEPSSSTLVTGSSRLANEEPAYKRRTTTIRVASPLHTTIRPITSTQAISQTMTLSSLSSGSYSPSATIRTINDSPPRFMSSGTSVSPIIETISAENDSNTSIIVSDSFAHSYSFINLDAEPEFEDNDETEADDENTIEQVNEYDVEIQTSD